MDHGIGGGAQGVIPFLTCTIKHQLGVIKKQSISYTWLNFEPRIVGILLRSMLNPGLQKFRFAQF
jgi:hypothetical protein